MDCSLTQAEYDDAERIGTMRWEENEDNGIVCNNPPPNQYGKQRMVEGAIAERAASKALGYPWKGKGIHGEADVGSDIEIKCTAYTQGHLIIQKTTPPNLKCILVIGQGLNYRLVGWKMSQDCKVPKYLRNPKTPQGREAYFVPQKDLKPCCLLADGELV